MNITLVDLSKTKLLNLTIKIYYYEKCIKTYTYNGNLNYNNCM